MTPETLYTNQVRFLKMGCPVFLPVTPSRNVSIPYPLYSFHNFPHLLSVLFPPFPDRPSLPPYFARQVPFEKTTSPQKVGKVVGRKNNTPMKLGHQKAETLSRRTTKTPNINGGIVLDVVLQYRGVISTIKSKVILLLVYSEWSRYSLSE